MTTRKNRIVELQEPVISRDPSFGSEVITWTTRATVWASFENLGKATERFIRKASKIDIIRLGQLGFGALLYSLMNGGESSKWTAWPGTWDTIGIKKGSQVGSDWTVQVKA